MAHADKRGGHEDLAGRFFESLSSEQRDMLALLISDPDARGGGSRAEGRSRKANFTFAAARIPVGSVLEYSDPRQNVRSTVLAEVKTVDDVNKVLYSGNVMSLSEAARRLSGSKTSARGPEYFTYKGKRLTDIRYVLGF